MLQKDYRITEITLDNTPIMALPVSFERVGVYGNNEWMEEEVRRACGVGSVHFIDKNLLLKTKTVRPQELLLKHCTDFLDDKIAKNKVDCAFDKTTLLKEIPTKWEKHGNLVMFNCQSFQSNIWHHPDNQRFWSGVAQKLGVNRVALMSTINNDDYRTPRVQMKYGTDGWVEHVDNGITYTYNVITNMFSKGNITEKLRVSQMDCRDEIVVDLFAGQHYYIVVQ